jgi:hypothetical protein
MKEKFVVVAISNNHSRRKLDAIGNQYVHLLFDDEYQGPPRTISAKPNLCRHFSLDLFFTVRLKRRTTRLYLSAKCLSRLVFSAVVIPTGQNDDVLWFFFMQHAP